jgi:hypothetical protein
MSGRPMPRYAGRSTSNGMTSNASECCWLRAIYDGGGGQEGM